MPASHGNWSGCHSASWDLNAPDVNELAYGTVFKRDDYMFGLIVNADGERFVDDGAAIPGLYAAGEIIGGIFYFNYPGGSGLMSAAVFGRIAGASAARAA